MRSNILRDVANTSLRRIVNHQKTAIIVGATGDIGQRFVEPLLDAEYAVLMVARNPEKLDALKKRVSGPDNQRYASLAYVPFDTSDAEACKIVVHECERIGFRSPNLIIFAAGDHQFDEGGDRQFLNVLDSVSYHVQANYLSKCVFYTALRDRLLVTRQAGIVLIGSIAGDFAPDDPRAENQVGYIASMRLVTAFADQLRGFHETRVLLAKVPLVEGRIADAFVARRIVSHEAVKSVETEVAKIVDAMCALKILTQFHY